MYRKMPMFQCPIIHFFVFHLNSFQNNLERDPSSHPNNLQVQSPLLEPKMLLEHLQLRKRPDKWILLGNQYRPLALFLQLLAYMPVLRHELTDYHLVQGPVQQLWWHLNNQIVDLRTIWNP